MMLPPLLLMYVALQTELPTPLLLMYVARETKLPLPSAAHTTVLLMMSVALHTTPPPLMPSTSAAKRTLQLLTIATSQITQLPSTSAPNRTMPLLTSTASQPALLPPPANCHQLNNIDDDNRCPSKRIPTGHRRKNVDAVVIAFNNRSMKATNNIAISHFDEVPDTVDRYVVTPRPFIHTD